MMTENENTIIPLGRARVERSGDAGSWTPREAVVEMLRMLDTGFKIDKLIICYDGIDGAGFQNATKTVMEAIGLLQVTQLEMYDRGRRADA